MKGQQRVTANSKRGRQLTSGGGLIHTPYTVPEDIRQWNKRIEEEKRNKKYGSAVLYNSRKSSVTTNVKG